jgi:hypothetical protein
MRIRCNKRIISECSKKMAKNLATWRLSFEEESADEEDPFGKCR